MSSWILPTVLVLGSLGCAGTPGSRREHTRLESTIDHLENSARKERRKVRDLEHELARLESELRDRERMPAHDRALVPRLPVEVLEPEEGQPAYAGAMDEAHAPADSPEEAYEIIGVDEDGYEIVYVGDAASDHSVAPETSYLTRSAPARSGRASSPAPSADLDREHDRLEVTNDVGPTVDRQLAQARDANRGARRPAAVTMPAERVAPARPSPARADKRAERSGSEPSAQYKRHYEALRAGDHASAIAGFESFIARWPRHELADNARYWLAEAHYDKRDYQTALTEFRKVRRDYPTGNKVPDAMLKIAFCQIALGDLAAARAALQELVAHHPKSQPAIVAARRLEILGKD